MKIFITGIAGFLGSHLAKHLIDLGHEVSGNDNMIGGDLKNISKQTQSYIPSILAIIFISKDPEKYGFNTTISLELGINETIDWFLENKDIIDERYNVFK